MKYKFYIDTKRVAKNGNEYWGRKYEGEVDYTKRKGDTVNRKGNIQRQIDSKTIHIFIPNTDIVEPEEEQTIFSTEQEIGRSLCSAINAILEVKEARVLSTEVKNNAFVLKYEHKGKEKEIRQPLI
jgi:hypothetical protein